VQQWFAILTYDAKVGNSSHAHPADALRAAIRDDLPAIITADQRQPL